MKRETLDQAFKVVKKFAESTGHKFIEVMQIRNQNHDGTLQNDIFRAYVPDCGFQDGETIAQLIENLKADWVKRGSPVADPEIDDLPF